MVLTDVGATALEDECAIVTEDPAQVLLCPQAWGTHSLNQVGAGEESDMDTLPFAAGGLNTPHDRVQLMVEVVQYLYGRQVLFVKWLPWVYADPLGAVLDSNSCHVDSVLSRGEASLLICIAYRAEEAAEDLVIGFEFAEVGGLFEHA